jgi:hypothetical protein
MMKLPAGGLRSQPAICLSYCNLIDHAQDAKPLRDKHGSPPGRQFFEVCRHLRRGTSILGRAEVVEYEDDARNTFGEGHCSRRFSRCINETCWTDNAPVSSC